MKEVSKLMDYRSDIRIVDATLRDGGLVNAFRFTDEFVKDLYQTNIKAGVDVMEFGYKASKEMFDVKDFGKWKFCDDEDIRAIVGDNDTNLKIAVMADVGRCDLRKDIHKRSESPIDVVRVATYLNQIPAAVEVIEDCAAKGYEVTCNIMAISNAQEADLDTALKMLAETNVDGVYLVDSYGSLYPEQIRALSDKYVDAMDAAGKYVGIHAHNNQQLAFANTIESMARGVSLLDATMSSMGRGAGNCAMELLLGFLKNPKYNLFPVLKFVETQMMALKEQGVVWGYDIPYFLTGRLNLHPSSAIDCMKAGRTDYTDFYTELLDRS